MCRLTIPVTSVPEGTPRLLKGAPPSWFFLSISSSLINLDHHLMASSQPQPRPLPKFGEWDEKNPSSGDSFTVIFAKARDEKRANSTGAGETQKNNKGPPPLPPPPPTKSEMEPAPSRFCCF
ncbi:hypothetical protein L2E82_33281 [Cichorium intybus]|uniref:Uncharacterized protein n=1 Tax=Cichorium intybus TaxID=13427 RepID=A0ACB9BJQ8_CICIN|nr:hypothetical protein L2E82_33281 [Cichorium intybus]